ncbi:thioesterase family protein, partial [Staphylococcus capitis]|uniref:thioesterase family protein n=1 Tax=Staphylococcus capitis TaxID=29388 RepID=UPI003709C297
PTHDSLPHLALTLHTIKTLHYTLFTLHNHFTFLKQIKLHQHITLKLHLYHYHTKPLHLFIQIFNSQQALTSTYQLI